MARPRKTAPDLVPDENPLEHIAAAEEGVGADAPAPEAEVEPAAAPADEQAAGAP